MKNVSYLTIIQAIFQIIENENNKDFSIHKEAI